MRLRWVMRLRWAGVVAQFLVVVTATTWMSAEMLRACAVVVAAIVSNAAVDVWLRRSTSRHETAAGPVVFAAIVVDVVLLTVLLAFTGGPLNPFTLLYVVHVATATVALSRPGSFAVAVLAVAGYGVLFLPGVFDAEAHMHQMHGPGFFAHVRGMWIAFSITAAFIVLFLGQLRHALEEREARIRDQQEARAREQRLASLATLAGGAAHELASPLSTIALVAESLTRQLQGSVPAGCRDDVVLLGQEVERCIQVLQQLSVDAGTPGGEQPTLTPIAPLLADAGRQTRATYAISPAAGERQVLAPPRALSSAIRGLIKNADQASVSAPTVSVELVRDDVVIEVKDDGPAVSDDVLARMGEPFFTTKGVGEGMGLGVFLARTVIEQCGGTLRYDRGDGDGLVATVTLPSVTAPSRRTSP